MSIGNEKKSCSFLPSVNCYVFKKYDFACFGSGLVCQTNICTAISDTAILFKLLKPAQLPQLKHHPVFCVLKSILCSKGSPSRTHKARIILRPCGEKRALSELLWQSKDTLHRYGYFLQISCKIWNLGLHLHTCALTCVELILLTGFTWTKKKRGNWECRTQGNI